MPSQSSRASWGWVALLAGLMGCAAAQPGGHASAPAPGAPSVVAFVGVSVLPLDSERVLSEQTVVVRGDQIVAVGPAASTPVPEGALRVDGRGRYLMPGLVDMHIRLPPDSATPSDAAAQQLTLLLANGVTTAQAFDAPASALALQGRVSRGEVLGPTLRLASPPAPGQAGKQVEHLEGLLAALLPPGDTAVVGPVEVGAALSRMDPARIPALAEAAKQSGTFHSPSMALFNILASEGAVPELRTSRELRYVPTPTVDAWTRQLLTGPLSQASVAGKHRFLELRRQVLQGLHTAGAPLLVGSDSPQLFLVPGFATHEEMEAMAAAGLPPLTVLQAATRNAAAYYAESAQWGSVAPGQRADLLLLNANPLQDVALTRAFVGVMVRGLWLPRSELDVRLDPVAAAARASKG